MSCGWPAGRQLDEAKARTRGGAAVAFLDLTADGNAPPAGRLPVTLRELDAQSAWLTQVAALPASRRQALLDLYRKGDTDGFTARLTDFAGNLPLWRVALGPAATAPAVRDELARSGDRRDAVRRALDIARHWHADPRAQDAQDSQDILEPR